MSSKQAGDKSQKSQLKPSSGSKTRLASKAGDATPTKKSSKVTSENVTGTKNSARKAESKGDEKKASARSKTKSKSPDKEKAAPKKKEGKASEKKEAKPKKTGEINL